VDLLLRDDLNHTDSLRVFAVAQMLAGIALIEGGRLEESLLMLNDSQANFAKLLNPNHPTIQLFGINKMIVLMKLRRYIEAHAVIDHAQPILEKAFGVDSPTYLRVESLRKRLLLEESAPVDQLPPPIPPQICQVRSRCPADFFS